MKIWQGYGTEHSMRLVMVGYFNDAEKAAASKRDIDRLIDQVRIEIDEDRMQLGWDQDRRFTDEIRLLLRELELDLLGPSDIENFAYDVSIDLADTRVELSTDEIDVAGFMKVMIHHGAKVEVYSGHEHEHGLVSDEA